MELQLRKKARSGDPLLQRVELEDIRALTWDCRLRHCPVFTGVLESDRRHVNGGVVGISSIDSAAHFCQCARDALPAAALA